MLKSKSTIYFGTILNPKPKKYFGKIQKTNKYFGKIKKQKILWLNPKSEIYLGKILKSRIHNQQFTLVKLKKSNHLFSQNTKAFSILLFVHVFCQIKTKNKISFCQDSKTHIRSELKLRLGFCFCFNK